MLNNAETKPEFQSLVGDHGAGSGRRARGPRLEATVIPFGA